MAEASGSNATYTPENPYLNRKDPDGSVPSGDSERGIYMVILSGGLVGARLNKVGSEPGNVYLVFGFASQGYSDDSWAEVEAKLAQWCEANDERHSTAGTGWILMTQGDGDYGQKSIESIARYVSEREPKVPVVFVQSDYAYAEPGTAYWPKYASAGFFGPGTFHQKVKLGKDGQPKLDKAGNECLAEAWGGYVKGKDGKCTGELGFPDAAIIHESFAGEVLHDHLGGIFVAGGGGITAEQVALYGFRTRGRAGDYFVPSFALDNSASSLNAELAPGYEEEAKATEKESGGTLKLTIAPPPELAPQSNVTEAVAAETPAEPRSCMEQFGC